MVSGSILRESRIARRRFESRFLRERVFSDCGCRTRTCAGSFKKLEIFGHSFSGFGGQREHFHFWANGLDICSGGGLVLSRKAVLPDPGLDTRLTANTPASRNRSRSARATKSRSKLTNVNLEWASLESTPLLAGGFYPIPLFSATYWAAHPLQESLYLVSGLSNPYWASRLHILSHRRTLFLFEVPACLQRPLS